MPEVYFDRYYRYDDLTRILHDFAEEHPTLVSLSSIGPSYEGRDIWLLALTNTATGPAEEKPAFWVDGNIHAAEVAPSSACLYLINRLVTQYGSDPRITHLLDTRALYICPRINPDGAEWALADQPKIVRSSTRPYPYNEDPIGGLIDEDVDGDGRILTMRVPDPNGPWKKHPDEPRLMVRRDPDEFGGSYYRVIPEGPIEDYDGINIILQRRKEGLDLNRNFPAAWRQEFEQSGAGPYPVSEPEVRAVVDFVAQHNNINGGVSFHTMSGVLLRPYGDKPDTDMPPEDLWVYQTMGAKGTELIGYPNVSIFHDFKYHPHQVISGGFDWIYTHLGMYMWAVEIWSPQRQAGIENMKFVDWYREHPIEDDLKLLRWNDEKLDRRGYVDWYEFDHPQLGKVELGGWDFLYAWRNPPTQYLESEIAPFSDWIIFQALATPRLELFRAESKALGGGSYRVTLAVQNTGWLPTYTTQVALKNKAVRGVVAEIELPENARLETGKLREELGHLEGRVHIGPTAHPRSIGQPTSDRLKTEWVIHAPAGGTVQLMARHDRAGLVRVVVQLE